ncbi:hypothetical protein [Arthrobacter sp. H14]|uniref:hypothetical protein n=1 Tax=Arthrobacter sp. H14 TaxID=1312959 RepID=UPI00047BD38C|nr:hypothetical protein [Arthrobacter sp. H14]
MRQTVGPLNRTWLASIGIITLLAGIAGVLLATGLATSLTGAAGLPAQVPPPSQPVVAGDLQSLIQPTAVAVVTAVAGLVLALLALGWLLKQVPRRNQARMLRLHNDGADGLTLCRPDVVTEAVAGQLEAFPGVVRSDAVLRGTASEPELTVHTTVGDRADIRELVDYICSRTAADVETALEVPLQRLAILLDISGSTKSSKTVVL